MIKVRYAAPKQLLIHDYMKYNSVEELISIWFPEAPPGTPIGPLIWADGVVIALATSPVLAESLVEELLHGIVHWFFVSFAVLDEYKPSVEVKGFTCNLIDVSNSAIYSAAARFLKTELESSSKNVSKPSVRRR
ncbi:MAG: hypothetical protein ACRECH_11490 [Nitrososphaerales archaeon]